MVYSHNPSSSHFAHFVLSTTTLIICLLILPRSLNAKTSPHIAYLDRNLLIADRGNNRIIEVTPDKRIVWAFHFEGLPPGHGADDAFFSPDNSLIVANLEEENIIVLIDYASRQIIWQYGDGTAGAGPNQLNSPDDAYILPDGNISVADIKNCRVISISPDKRIIRQYGSPGRCISGQNYYNKPDGATPLADGHLLITEIKGGRITEINRDGFELYSFQSPAIYPSDAQETTRNTIIVADYVQFGAIYETDRTGHVVWQFGPFREGSRRLNKPSLAAEMPNGYVVANDDFNHRVIVIDKATHEIVWQYGVTGVAGDEPGYLNIPDGVAWPNDVLTRITATPMPTKEPF